MNGGAYDSVAAYIDNGHSCLTRFASDLVNGVAKYKNVYYSTVKDGSYAQAADYEYTNPNYIGTYPSGYTKKYGDAVWETSPGGTYGMNDWKSAWYDDSASFPYDGLTFFIRGGKKSGGSSSGGSSDGVFSFFINDGSADPYDSFRVVVPVL